MIMKVLFFREVDALWMTRNAGEGIEEEGIKEGRKDGKMEGGKEGRKRKEGDKENTRMKNRERRKGGESKGRR